MLLNLVFFGFFLLSCASTILGEDCVDIEFWYKSREHCLGALRSEDHECYWRCVDDLSDSIDIDKGHITLEKINAVWKENVHDEEVLNVLNKAHKKCIESLSEFDGPCAESKNYHICVHDDPDVQKICPRLCEPQDPNIGTSWCNKQSDD